MHQWMACRPHGQNDRLRMHWKGGVAGQRQSLLACFSNWRVSALGPLCRSFCGPEPTRWWWWCPRQGATDTTNEWPPRHRHGICESNGCRLLLFLLLRIERCQSACVAAHSVTDGPQRSLWLSPMAARSQGSLWSLVVTVAAASSAAQLTPQ